MNKRERMSMLFDLYGMLLTKKQQDYFQDYYFEDLTYQEISENYEVSKAAVFDQIRKVEDTLQRFEDGLKIHEKLIYRNKIIHDIIKQTNDTTLIQKLTELLE